MAKKKTKGWGNGNGSTGLLDPPGKKKKTSKKKAKAAKKKAKKKASKKGSEPEAEEEKKPKGKQVVIAPPNLQVARFTIVGTAPYVQSKFSEKAKHAMREAQRLGSVAKKGKKREPKDFEGAFEQAIHYSDDGWAGIPASGVRAAMISACRVCGFAMTRAKLSVFCLADGYDATDGTPLVKIKKGKPKHVEHCVRIQQTTDLRVRAMWDPGWEADLTLEYDGDQFDLSDVTNLLLRVGMQVGLGEGRHDSRSSAGMGWGTFRIKG
jgi:hypothetical protein